MNIESNVLSWNIALEKGYEPRLYPYMTDLVSLGEYEAMLDVKIWASKAMTICCYFTQKNSGMRFQLTVYRRQKDKEYRLDSGDLDLKICPTTTVYLISVGLNGKQKATFKNALLLIQQG